MGIKRILSVVLVVIVFLAVLGFAKDQLVKSVITATGSHIIGAPLRIGGFSLGVLRQKVKVKNLKIYNPRGFPKGVLIDIPKITVDYNLFSLLSGKLHLRQLALDLKEAGVIKNKDGELNVDALKVSQQKEAKRSKQLAMQVELFNLNVGRLVFKDYSSGGKPSIDVYDINLKKSYRNINSGEELIALIVSEPMKAVGIKGAAIYGVAGVAGMALLPVTVAGAMVGKDSAQENFKVNFQTAYSLSLAILKDIGKVNSETREKGLIKAKVEGSNVTVKIKSINAGFTQISVSARKFGLPKAQVASGVLYRIRERLK